MIRDEKRRLCDCIGCSETATATRSVETILDGYMRDGKFVSTRVGVYDFQLCNTHAGDWDTNPNSIQQQCYY